MSAAMTEVGKETDAEREKHHALSHWGNQLAKVLMDEGYMDRSAIDRLFEGIAHLSGHNILMRDMTPEAWDVHVQVINLAPVYRDVLVARYAVPTKPNGLCYSRRELAKILDCSFEAYKQRLKRAKSMILV